MPNLVPPEIFNPVVKEDGRMSDLFSRWVIRMTLVDPIVGTGSPEGVVSALVGQTYIDDTSTTVALYIKQKADISGDQSKGWFGLTGAPA